MEELRLPVRNGVQHLMPLKQTRNELLDAQKLSQKAILRGKPAPKVRKMESSR